MATKETYNNPYPLCNQLSQYEMTSEMLDSAAYSILPF